MQGPLESSQGKAVREAALAGLGIALFSVWHSCDDLRAGRLQVVFADHAVPLTGIYAMTPHRRLMPPRAPIH